MPNLLHIQTTQNHLENARKPKTFRLYTVKKKPDSKIQAHSPLPYGLCLVVARNDKKAKKGK